MSSPRQESSTASFYAMADPGDQIAVGAPSRIDDREVWRLVLEMVAERYDARCHRCYRPIRTFESVRVMLGPVCRRRESAS